MTARPLRIHHPFLIAIYPVLFLYSRNMIEFRFIVVVVPIVILLAASLVGWAGLSRILHDRGRAALLVSFSLLGFFSYGHIYDVLWRFLAVQPSALGPRKIALAVHLLLFLVGVVLIVRARRRTNLWNRLANVAAVGLVAFPLLQIITHPLRLEAAPSETIREGVEAGVSYVNLPRRQPDVYYLILDEYARGDILADLYGFDNGEMEAYLRARGFVVGTGATANYCQTVLSICSALNFNYLDSLVPEMDPNSDDRMPLTTVLYHNRLLAFLKARGYETVSVASGCVYTDLENADVFVETGAPLLFLDEFQNGLLAATPLPLILSKLHGLPLLDRRIGELQANAHRGRVLQQFAELQGIARRPGPKVVFAHFLVPHAPYVFGPDGEFLSLDEIFNFAVGVGVVHNQPERAAEYAHRYIGQLRFVNTLVRATIDSILAVPGTDPIIIVHADHGSGLQLDWDDIGNTNLRERMSILNAVRLPGECDPTGFDSVTPINSTRLVLNRCFGAGLPLLPDKSIFSPYDRPFKFTDVTDQVRTSPLPPVAGDDQDPRIDRSDAGPRQDTAVSE